MALKQFTIKEVSAHNKESDLWLIIDRKVYDVTSFTDEHPGGIDTLLDSAGMDGIAEFEGVSHSDSARRDLKKYLIGELAAGETAAPAKHASSSSTASLSAVAFIVALVAAVAYLILRP